MVWDALFELTDKEKAEIAKLWAEAADKARSAIGQPVMTADEYRGEWTPFSDAMPPLPELPAQEKDVIEQVEEVVSNYGFGPHESKAFSVAVRRMMAKKV